MTHCDFKTTLTINFFAYVQLSRLFLSQKQKQDEHSHIVNVISIAGMQGMISGWNSDYGSSKQALGAFFDSLRQELEEEGSPVKITNVYPYIIDTNLFKGFSGIALNLIPMLKKERVAARILEAFLHSEEEVYDPWYAYWLGVGMLFVPSTRLRNVIRQTLMGNGMKTFIGNQNKKSQ